MKKTLTAIFIILIIISACEHSGVARPLDDGKQNQENLLTEGLPAPVVRIEDDPEIEEKSAMLHAEALMNKVVEEVPEDSQTISGTAPRLTVVAFPSGENKVVLVRETHPDGSSLKPGTVFTKEWELKNTGTNTLGKDCYLELQEGLGGLFGAPQKIVFGKAVEPNESITLSAKLTAPSENGSYTVKYRIADGTGADIRIRGGNVVWLQVNVGENVVAGVGNIYNPDLQNISFWAGRVEGDENQTTIQVCASFSTRDYEIGGAPVLILDGKRHGATGGGDDWQIGGDHCVLFRYNLSLQSYEASQTVLLSFEKVRIGVNYLPLTPGAMQLCNEARTFILANYTGLDFSCDEVVGGLPYSALQVPNGMTRAQAERIVLDAIHKAVYVTTVIHIK